MNKRKYGVYVSLALLYIVLLFFYNMNGYLNELSNQIIMTPRPESGAAVTFRGAMVDGAWYNPQDVVENFSEGVFHEENNTLDLVDGQQYRVRLSSDKGRKLVFNVGPDEGTVNIRVGDKTFDWDLYREETNDLGESFLLPMFVPGDSIKRSLVAFGGLFVLVVVMCLFNRYCRSYHSDSRTAENNRNSAVELVRFLISLCVVFHHSTGVTPGGYLGVDFFFVLSGFLLMRHFMAHENPDTSEAAVTAVRYTYGRYCRLLPPYLFAFFLSLGMMVCLGKGGSLNDMITWNFWELTMSEVFGLTENLVVAPGWYCSALLAAGFCIYFLLSKDKKAYLYCVAPLSLLLVFGWMHQKFGYINRWLQFDGLIPIGTGALRGFAEMGLGCICYEVATKIRDRGSNKRAGRWFSTLLEFISLAYVLKNIFKDAPSERDFICVFAMAALITSLFVGKSLWSRLVPNRVAQWLGSISIGIYLLHNPIQQINWTNLGAHFGMSWGGAFVLHIFVVIILAAISTPFVKNIKAWMEAGISDDR